MKKLMIIGSLILLFLSGCVHNKITIQPICRHTSVLCALTAGEKYPVRIIHGETIYGEHAEAQAFINGNWKRLRLNKGEVEVAETKTYWIIIYKYVTVEQALKWSTKRFKTIKPGEKQWETKK